MKAKRIAVSVLACLLIAAAALAGCEDDPNAYGCRRPHGNRARNAHVHEVQVGDSVTHIDHCHDDPDRPHSHNWDR